jgi:hypothetical protein
LLNINNLRIWHGSCNGVGIGIERFDPADKREADHDQHLRNRPAHRPQLGRRAVLRRHCNLHRDAGPADRLIAITERIDTMKQSLILALIAFVSTATMIAGSAATVAI